MSMGQWDEARQMRREERLIKKKENYQSVPVQGTFQRVCNSSIVTKFSRESSRPANCKRIARYDTSFTFVRKFRKAERDGHDSSLPDVYDDRVLSREIAVTSFFFFLFSPSQTDGYSDINITHACIYINIHTI